MLRFEDLIQQSALEDLIAEWIEDQSGFEEGKNSAARYAAAAARLRAKAFWDIARRLNSGLDPKAAPPSRSAA